MYTREFKEYIYKWDNLLLVECFMFYYLWHLFIKARNQAFIFNITLMNNGLCSRAVFWCRHLPKHVFIWGMAWYISYQAHMPYESLMSKWTVWETELDVPALVKWEVLNARAGFSRHKSQVSVQRAKRTINNLLIEQTS